MCSNVRRPLPRDGFTFLELLIVVLVLAVVSLNVAPRFAQAIVRQSVTTAARRVMIDVEQTRLRAKSTATTHSLLFAPDLDAYFVPELTPVESNQTVYRVDVSLHPYNASIVDVQFAFENDFDVAFNEHGIPDSTGFVDIQVGKYRRTVSIEETGEVELGPVTLMP